jgi:prepilin-type processing-associated H-X9-DG protein
MQRQSNSYCKARQRSALTLIEVLIVIVVILILLALLFPSAQKCITDHRRIQCNNNLKNLAYALHNYAQANKAFPAGTICGSRPSEPGNQYDVWTEAGKTGPGNHGTSFLLAVLPFIEEEALFKTWASGQKGSGTTVGCWSPANNVGVKNSPGPSIKDIKIFYCPTRRESLRAQDSVMMLSPASTGGGTDYGGCAGRHAAFTLETGYSLCDASMHYEPEFALVGTWFKKDMDDADKRWGIFGRVNRSTTFTNIRDGCSNTIMMGELQRITDVTPGSKDGWAVGGPATLFTTGAMVSRIDSTLIFVDSSTSGKMSNNGFFGSPGSDHSNGANYSFVDGSVQFLRTSIDPTTFALMGSMGDAEPCSFDE